MFSTTLSTVLTIASLLALPSSHAATQIVQVGAGGGLTFTPSSVAAPIGDVIQFQFLAGNHTATQSTFAFPCAQFVNSSTATLGFDSGFIPGAAASPPTFDVKVTSLAPIWVYCRRGNHCTSGMVFAVNAPATGNTFDAYLTNAKNFQAGGSNSTATGATGASSATSAATGVSRITSGATSAASGASGASGATTGSGTATLSASGAAAATSSSAAYLGAQGVGRGLVGVLGLMMGLMV